MPKMHGPCLGDPEGAIVNTDVHPDNVYAFEQAGWVVGEQVGAPNAADVTAQDAKPVGRPKVDKE